MTEAELYGYLLASHLFSQWHWFRWHFEHRLRGGNHPLAASIVHACLECDARIPGFARAMADAIASLSGREKYLPHLEQLLQRLCELLVIRQAIIHEWPAGTAFHREPAVAPAGKNPELLIRTGDASYGIEVKAPAIFDHWRRRGRRPLQLAARAIPKEDIGDLVGSPEDVTLPRDNPIKDFLISANSKFESLKRAHEGFSGILVIVWDDFIYEPISALMHPECGLFTENSFARDDRGGPLRFDSIDGVVIIRHLHQLVRSCRDEPLVDGCQHALDYGRPGEFPFKAFLQNPRGSPVSLSILECLQAIPPGPVMGAEYVPNEIISWFGR